jgi:hypothetical protein
MFDSSGRFVGSFPATDTARGAAFRGEAVFASTITDSIFAFDYSSFRFLQFSPAGVFVGFLGVGIPSAGTARAVLADAIVVSGAIRTRSQAGLPFHIYDRSGRWLRSFGQAVPIVANGSRDFPDYVIVPAGRDQFWTIPRGEYVLKLWRIDGRLLREFRMQRAWFQRWTVPRRPSRDSIPQTQVADARLDSAGRLWIVLNVPDGRWRNSFGPEVPVNMPSSLVSVPRITRRVVDLHSYFDSILEVVDATTGNVVGSKRFDEAISWLLTDGTAVGAEHGRFNARRVWRAQILISKERGK